MPAFRILPNPQTYSGTLVLDLIASVEEYLDAQRMADAIEELDAFGYTVPCWASRASDSRLSLRYSRAGRTGGGL